jgi:GEVED domain
VKRIFLISLIVLLAALGVNIYKKNIYNQKTDDGDAPSSYGVAIHYKSDIGPYFGKTRGFDNNKDSIDYMYFANTLKGLDFIGKEDAIAFTGDSTSDLARKTPLFAPEIIAENPTYNLTVPVNEAEKGDPITGWIDFDGNGLFDDYEKAYTEFGSGNTVTITWRLPLNLHSALTFLRLRTCKKLYREEIQKSTGTATTGEVEDFVVRINKTVIPSTELKEKVDYNSLTDLKSLDDIEKAIGNLSFGDRKLAIKLYGQKPDVFGINSMHDASVTGLRIGHNDSTVITEVNPIIITFKSSSLLENFNFQIVDIDGGDRFKIEGFKNGKPVDFDLSNLSDNYFYQFDINKKEVFGAINSDSGGDEIMQSSLDMAINIGFKDYVDSVKLTYTDDLTTSSGTFTLGNFSMRKYHSSGVSTTNLVALESNNDVYLKWQTNNAIYLNSFLIERSLDGISYEVISNAKKGNSSQVNFDYIDKSLAPNIQICYYRIKMIEIDNHISYSNTFRLKKNLSKSLLGFRSVSPFFSSEIKLILLKDMPNDVRLNMYNYSAKKVTEFAYKNKLKGDTIILSNLKLPEDIYYLELINASDKYLIEVTSREYSKPK